MIIKISVGLSITSYLIWHSNKDELNEKKLNGEKTDVQSYDVWMAEHLHVENFSFDLQIHPQTLDLAAIEYLNSHFDSSLDVFSNCI